MTSLLKLVLKAFTIRQMLILYCLQAVTRFYGRALSLLLASVASSSVFTGR